MAPSLIDYGFYASLPAHLGSFGGDVVPLVNGFNIYGLTFTGGMVAGVHLGTHLNVACKSGI